MVLARKILLHPRKSFITCPIGQTIAIPLLREGNPTCIAFIYLRSAPFSMFLCVVLVRCSIPPRLSLVTHSRIRTSPSVCQQHGLQNWTGARDNSLDPSTTPLSYHPRSSHYISLPPTPHMLPTSKTARSDWLANISILALSSTQPQLKLMLHTPLCQLRSQA